MSRTLVDRELRDMITKGVIRSTLSLDDYVQPASIDIPAGFKGFHINHKFLPFHNKIERILENEVLEEFD
jgi:hypothetical protein